MPTFGKHTLDEDLCALMWRHHGACQIVTRNRHTKEIQAFLASHGAPDVPIHTVHKGEAK